MINRAEEEGLLSRRNHLRGDPGNTGLRGTVGISRGTKSKW